MLFFFQCSRAILRSGLWDSSTQLERSVLPSAGKILQEISKNALDGADYDARLPQLLKNNMY